MRGERRAASERRARCGVAALGGAPLPSSYPVRGVILGGCWPSRARHDSVPPVAVHDLGGVVTESRFGGL
ncbi:hypothetical protein ACFPRL_03540 [Pseudoclavibacter helvolus]